MKRLLGALALACVFSGAAVAGEMPGVNSGSVTSTTGNTATAPGEMPGVNSAISSETDASLVTTVLLTILTLIGR